MKNLSSALGALAIIALYTLPAQGEIIGVREAEQTTITCTTPARPYSVGWASGGFIAAASWGHTAGDKLEFDLDTDNAWTDLKLGIRYAYFAAWHKRDEKNPGPRELQLTIDGTTNISVAVPDTDGWNHFEVAEVALPPLQPGRHEFALSATADFCATNIDAFVFYSDPVNLESNGILRSTRLVDPKEGIVLCASDLVKLTEPASVTHKTLQDLYELMAADFGKDIPVKLYFHLTDKSRWWNTEAPVVQNQFGIYVLADGRPYDRAEWCWAMARFLARNTGVPTWFADSTSRVSGWMDWLPSVTGDVSDLEMQNAAVALGEGQDFLESADSKCDKVETVHMAVRQKYGADVFSRFWSLVENKRQEFGSPLKLDKFQVIALLSEAAGEDVLPLYKRWTGFKSEGPVDPLVLVYQATDAEE